jgi:hypothetical protein
LAIGMGASIKVELIKKRHNIRLLKKLWPSQRTRILIWKTD